MKANKKETWAYIGLSLMAIIIGFSFIFIKLALQHSSALDLLAHRFTTATAGLLIYYLFFRRKKPNIQANTIPTLLVLSLFYPIMLFGLQTVGLKYTTASEAGILSATAPIFTIILATIFLKEKYNLKQILCVILSVAGVIYIMFKNGSDIITKVSIKGNIFILLSVLAIAIYYVLGRKANKQFNSMDITFFMSFIAFLIFNAVAIVTHVKAGTLVPFFKLLINPAFLLPILYLGVLSTFLTSFLSNNALSIIPAAQVSIFNNFSPVLSVFGGILFLNERLHIWHIIGGLLVLAGIIGVNVFRKQESQKSNI